MEEGTPIVERLDEFAANYAGQGPGTMILIREPRSTRPPEGSGGRRPKGNDKRAVVCRINEEGTVELLCDLRRENGRELYKAIVGHGKVHLPAGVKIDTGKKETFIPDQNSKERRVTVVVKPLKAHDGATYAHRADVYGVPEKRSGKKPYSVVVPLEKLQSVLVNDP